MLELVSIVGLALAAVASCSRRTWPFLALVGAVWGLQLVADLSFSILQALAWRTAIDVLAAALCARMATSDLGRVVTGFFVLMLVNHAAFWLSRHLLINDFWLFYSHSGNALWLGQLAVLAVPGGAVFVGRFDSLRDGFGWGHKRSVDTRVVSPGDNDGGEAR